MINRVVLVGRLVKDPNELRHGATGVAVTNFTIAVDNRFATKDANKTADFIPCVVFNKTAEIVTQYARKGMLVGVEGRLQTRSYDNKENQKVFVMEVVVDSFQMLESKSSTESRQSSNQGSFVQPTPSSNAGFDANSGATYDISDDDLPF